MPPRVFQPWPTQADNGLKYRRSGSKLRKGVKRAFRSSFSASLPVEPADVKLRKVERKSTECTCCLGQKPTNDQSTANNTIDLTNDRIEDMDLSMVNTTAATDVSFVSDCSAMDRPMSELSFSKGLEKSSNAGKYTQKWACEIFKNLF